MGGTVAVDRIREYNTWPNGTAQSTLTFDFNLWPIPQSVIDRNKDVVLEQNPGWKNK
jgi:starch-binding outer membrane protein, SusD/RagB family